MNTPSDQSLIISEYLRQKDAGKNVDVDALCKKYPDMADGLRSYLAGEALFDPAINPDQNSLASEIPTSVSGSIDVNAETIAPGASFETDTPQNETLFGRYQLKRELGQGAMGTVYCAHDTQLDCLVALKIPKPAAYANTEFLKRFQREAQSSAKLSHPNLCRVFDFGIHEGTPYISMDFIEGQPLSRFVGTPTYQEQLSVAKLIRELATGLEHAHQNNVIHRDIKPANILIDSTGKPVITDFGLARKLEQAEESRMTQDGILVGTPAYMAPEQMAGIQSEVGASSDIFSLGVIFFELLVGELPFKGSVAELITQVCRDVPPPPSQYRDDLDLQLEKLCLKMMGKQPKDRPKSMSEVIKLLTEWIDSPASKTDPQVKRKQERQQKLEAARKNVNKLLQKNQFAKAITQLEKISHIQDKDAIKYVQWADEELVKTKKSVEEYQENLSSTTRLAKQLIQKYDYAQAVSLLEELPAEFQTAQTQSLLYRAKDLHEESTLLIETIQNLIQRKSLRKIKTRLNRLLEIKPGNKMAQELYESLNTYGKGKDYQFDDRGKLIPSSSGLDAFGGVRMAAIVGGVTLLVALGIVTLLRKPQEGIAEVTVTPSTDVVDRHEIEKPPEPPEILEAPEEAPPTLPDAPDQKKLILPVGTSEYLNPDWMEKRLAQVGIDDLITEYAGQSNKNVQTIKATLDLSRHVLKDQPEALREQLQARLVNRKEPTFAPFQALPNDRIRFRSEWDTFNQAGGPLVRTLSGHAGGVISVAITPDGKQVISGSSDGTLKVWDIASGKELRTLTGYSSNIRSVAITPDGKQAISASDDKTLKVWDIASGKELRTLRGHASSVWSVAITPDGKQVISGSYDKTLKVWDIASGKELYTLRGHANLVRSVAITPDGKQAISASDDKTLKVWDIASGKELRTLKGHSSNVQSVAITPDGKRVISSSGDKTLKVWDIASGKELRTLTRRSFGATAATSVAITLDGKQVISGSYDGTLKVWDINSGRELHTFMGHSFGVTSVAITPDGKQVISSSDDKTLKVWNIANGRELRTFTGHIRPVWSVAITPDGKQTISASFNGTLKVWDIDSGRELRTFSGRSYVPSVAITPDGKQVVSGSSDKMLKVWDIASGRELRTLSGHSKSVTSVAITPDGKQVISGSYDKTLKVWDIASGRELRTLSGHSRSVTSVAITPDGKQVISGSGDKTLKVWDIASGRELRTLKGHSSNIQSVAITPDGKQVISSSSDKTLKVWNIANGRVLRTLTGHSNQTRNVVITPDGKQVISGSLWDIASGKLLTNYQLDDTARSIAIGSDGKTLVVGGYSGRVYNLTMIRP